MTQTPATSHGPTALVRRPSPRMAEGLLTHLERRPVDVDLAREQWAAYVAALEGAGWRTVEVPPADECPDAAFVEDTVVVHEDLAVITLPGAPERRPETAGTEAVLRDLGYRVVHVEAPGTLDGGDVLKLGDRAWVGTGGRTNDSGVAQLADALAAYGVRTTGLPLTKVLHLKSAVTALDDGTTLCHPPLWEESYDFDPVLEVPEEPGSHVVRLGGGRVLLSAAAPRTAELLTARGLEVVPVDITEFEALEGCVTCLSVRLRGGPAGAPAGGTGA